MSTTIDTKYKPGDWVTAPVDTGQMWLARVVGEGSHQYCITCHCDPVNPEHRLDGSLCCPGPWYSVELYEPGGGALPGPQTYAEHELTRQMNLQETYQNLIASYGWNQVLALARTVTDAYAILDGAAARGATLRMVPKHEERCKACPATVVGYEVDARPPVCTCSDSRRPTQDDRCVETVVYELCVQCGVQLRELLFLYA